MGLSLVSYYWFLVSRYVSVRQVALSCRVSVRQVASWCLGASRCVRLRRGGVVPRGGSCFGSGSWFGSLVGVVSCVRRSPACLSE